jgi:hypothetical protein
LLTLCSVYRAGSRTERSEHRCLHRVVRFLFLLGPIPHAGSIYDPKCLGDLLNGSEHQARAPRVGGDRLRQLTRHPVRTRKRAGSVIEQLCHRLQALVAPRLDCCSGVRESRPEARGAGRLAR